MRVTVSWSLVRYDFCCSSGYVSVLRHFEESYIDTCSVSVRSMLFLMLAGVTV